MRNLIAASVLALGLTACQTATTVPTSPVVNTVVSVLPERVQEIAVQACGYLPAAETVANLIAAFGGPQVPGIATQIASEICGAVTKKSVVPGRAKTVRGVAIRGQFVR